MNKLESMLNYASEHNTFYKNNQVCHNCSTNSIHNYKVVEKDTLQNKKFLLLSNDYKEKAFDTLIRRTTSGSSGMPVDVYWNKEDYTRSVVSLWRFRKKYYNISPTSKQVNFTFNQFQIDHHIKGLEYFLNNNILSFSRSSFLDNKDYDIFYTMIINFQPEWMYIQPFVLDSIVMYLQRNNLSLPDSIRYIECVGEILTPGIRRKAEQYLRLPITNMYGSEEMNGIAIECPYKRMHILEDNVYVECKTKSGLRETGEGEIILTNLNNHAMPLIRYAQGDIVNIEKGSTCTCGCKSKYISIIKGRQQDSFMAAGYIVNSYILVEVIASLNNILGGPILHFKYIYNTNNNELIVNIVLSPEFRAWESEIKKTLIELLRKENVRGIRIGVKVLENINQMPNSKFKVLEII